VFQKSLRLGLQALAVGASPTLRDVLFQVSRKCRQRNPWQTQHQEGVANRKVRLSNHNKVTNDET